jgi:uncharacterized protein
MLNDAVREDIRNSVLCWFATVDADGQPNVSPKELFCEHGDDAIVVAEVASPVTVRNLVRNPRVCVSFVDVFRQRGFKLTGLARLILPDEPEFQGAGERLFSMAGPDIPVRGVIHVTITRIARIWAPSYALFPDRTVDEQMRRGHEIYGVKPV